MKKANRGAKKTEGQGSKGRKTMIRGRECSKRISEDNADSGSTGMRVVRERTTKSGGNKESQLKTMRTAVWWNRGRDR